MEDKRSKSPEVFMLYINERRVFNLTGQEIKLAADNGSYIVVPSDGIAKVYYSESSRRRAEYLTNSQYDGKECKNSTGVLTPKIYKSSYVYWLDDWFYEWDGDFIVPFEFYFTCRETDLPTDRLYTVAGAIDAWNVGEGCCVLIKD